LLHEETVQDRTNCAGQNKLCRTEQKQSMFACAGAMPILLKSFDQPHLTSKAAYCILHELVTDDDSRKLILGRMQGMTYMSKLLYPASLETHVQYYTSILVSLSSIVIDTLLVACLLEALLA